MWQRFTERARRIILLGQEEAGRMNSGHVGTEHLLLGLVRENEGVAAQVLQKMGVSLPKVRREIEIEVDPNRDEISYGGEPKLTPKAKRVLELAADEARLMRHNYIGTEHLLLALLREKDGLAATVLRRLGLNLEKTRAQVMEYLGPDAPPICESEFSPGTKSQPESPADSPEGQIERNLRRFVDNLIHGSALSNQSLIFGARYGWFGAHEWAETWNRKLPERQIQLLDITIDLIESEGESEKARVAVSYRLKSVHPEPDRLPAVVRAWDERTWSEILDFKTDIDSKGRTVWQIVPAEEFPRPDFENSLALLGQAAFSLSQKRYADTLKHPATRALNHLNHLSLGITMLVGDFGSFAFAPQYVRPALEGYLSQLEGQTEVFLAGSAAFTVPDTDEQFHFNSNLCELSPDDIAQAAHTVMFYDGDPKNLAFRYDGHAAVAFADGQCRLISREEAEILIWKP